MTSFWFILLVKSQVQRLLSTCGIKFQGTVYLIKKQLNAKQFILFLKQNEEKRLKAYFKLEAAKCHRQPELPLCLVFTYFTKEFSKEDFFFRTEVKVRLSGRPWCDDVDVPGQPPLSSGSWQTSLFIGRFLLNKLSWRKDSILFFFDANLERLFWDRNSTNMSSDSACKDDKLEKLFDPWWRFCTCRGWKQAKSKVGVSWPDEQSSG